MNPWEQKKALDAWQASARYWDKYRVLIAQMFVPLTSGLVGEARIGIGQKVLDIRGGSGEPSLAISCIVGWPTGSVMYTDPAAGMVETAQAEAARSGLTNIHFRQCSADDLPFENRAFDVAVSSSPGTFELKFSLSLESHRCLGRRRVRIGGVGGTGRVFRAR